MDARIFTPILPILGILAVRMMDIRTRKPKKTTETDGRTRTAFRNSVATSTTLYFKLYIRLLYDVVIYSLGGLVRLWITSIMLWTL